MDYINKLPTNSSGNKRDQSLTKLIFNKTFHCNNLHHPLTFLQRGGK